MVNNKCFTGRLTRTLTLSLSSHDEKRKQASEDKFVGSSGKKRGKKSRRERIRSLKVEGHWEELRQGEEGHISLDSDA